MRVLATALFLILSGSSLSGPGVGATTATPVEHRALLGDPAGYGRYSVGIDTWEVWICHLPQGSAEVTAEDASRVLTAELVPYFTEMSAGLYEPRFVPAGMARASDSDERYPCEHEIEQRTSGTEKGAIVITNELGIPAAYALLDRIDTTPSDRFPANGRVIRVGAHTVLPEAWNFEPKRITHEIGHAIGWPHSFSGLREDSSQYDNPLDVMSTILPRTGPLRGRAQGTLAVNRLAAGWLDDDQVAVATEPRAEYRIVPLGLPGTQLVVIPTGHPDVLVTLDARVSSGHDTGIGKEGVAVHLVDQRPEACGHHQGCFGPQRRTQPLLDANETSLLYHHVLTVGETIHYLGHRIEVTDRTGDSFHLSISTTEPLLMPL